MKRIIGAIAGFIVLVVVLVLLFGSWGTVSAGHRGIVMRMGKITGEVKGEGFYSKTPWLDSIWPVSVQVQKEETEAHGASKDLQSVKTTIALNLSIIPETCPALFQKYGGDYLNSFVAPAVQESTKAVLAKYTAEELIAKREKNKPKAKPETKAPDKGN